MGIKMYPTIRMMCIGKNLLNLTTGNFYRTKEYYSCSYLLYVYEDISNITGTYTYIGTYQKEYFVTEAEYREMQIDSILY